MTFIRLSFTCEPNTQILRNAMKPKETNSPEPIAYSVEDAARAVGLGRTKLFELIRTGQITAVKVGGRTLVPVDSLRSFIIRRTGASSPNQN